MLDITSGEPEAVINKLGNGTLTIPVLSLKVSSARFSLQKETSRLFCCYTELE